MGVLYWVAMFILFSLWMSGLKQDIANEVVKKLNEPPPEPEPEEPKRPMSLLDKIILGIMSLFGIWLGGGVIVSFVWGLLSAPSH